MRLYNIDNGLTLNLRAWDSKDRKNIHRYLSHQATGLFEEYFRMKVSSLWNTEYEKNTNGRSICLWRGWPSS